MTKLFSEFMESYDYQKNSRVFKKKECELVNETKNKKGHMKVANLPKKMEKTISNNVMVTIDGRDWKEMSVAKAKAAVATLKKKGKKAKIKMVQENQVFDIDALLEADELNADVLAIIEELERNTITEGKTSITVDWASDERGLDKKLSKKYGITIKDDGGMEATITGDAKKIKKFLLGDDYGMDLDVLEDYYPELNK